MIKELKLFWRTPTNNRVRVVAIGNVQTVINSCANKLFNVPSVMYGLGALTFGTASEAGEGIVYRGHTGITPPVTKAGTVINFREALSSVSSPFFLGWSGEPTAEGMFTTDGNTTLKEIYEAVFRHLELKPVCIMLEIIGLLMPSGIHDRALRKPADRGNVLITSPEYATQYFRSEIIKRDLVGQNYPIGRPFPLVIVGAGYRPQDGSPMMRQFEQMIFYQPPILGERTEEISQSMKLWTHNHAMGWINNNKLREVLQGLHPEMDPADALNKTQKVVEETAKETPTYVVHLDDWSQLLAGVVRVFAVDELNIELVDKQ